MPAESYDDDEEEQEGPKSSFGTYLAEGDALYKQSEYKKALESYSLALELQPEDKNCLVARSKCYLKLGDPQKALQDAESALAEDKEFNKGLYRKAEALYCMGDFEYALMYYHRGHNLRPELDEFRLGIQKAQEAIDNSIGSAAKIKLENKGDLSFFNRQDDLGNKKRAGYSKPRNLKLKPTIANRNKETKPPAPSKKTVKQLLGELYADKEYLQKLMEDEDFIKNHSNKPVYELVQDGLTYLDTRTEFWRQQKPLYARRKDRGKPSGTKKKGKMSQGKQVLAKLEAVDQALADGDVEKSLKLAQTLLKSVEEMNLNDLPNKVEVLANIHSCIGNAFVELENLDCALKHHQKDLDLSLNSKSMEGKSRALDNVGRVYARMGEYEKAVESWNEKLPLLKAPLETTWIYHEIGRCHLELEDYDEARDCGRKSLKAAREFGDEAWQLNALVLLAQALVKLGKLNEGLRKFEEAKELSLSLSDSAAENAITKAIEDLEKKLEEGENTTTAPTSNDDENTHHSHSKDENDDDDDDDDVLTPRVLDKESDHDVTSDVDNNHDEGDATEDDVTDDIVSPREDEYEKTKEETDTESYTEEDPTDSLISPRQFDDDSDDEEEEKDTSITNDNTDDVSSVKITTTTTEDGTTTENNIKPSDDTEDDVNKLEESGEEDIKDEEVGNENAESETVTDSINKGDAGTADEEENSIKDQMVESSTKDEVTKDEVTPSNDDENEIRNGSEDQQKEGDHQTHDSNEFSGEDKNSKNKETEIKGNNIDPETEIQQEEIITQQNSEEKAVDKEDDRDSTNENVPSKNDKKNEQQEVNVERTHEGNLEEKDAVDDKTDQNAVQENAKYPTEEVSTEKNKSQPIQDVESDDKTSNKEKRENVASLQGQSNKNIENNNERKEEEKLDVGETPENNKAEDKC